MEKATAESATLSTQLTHKKNKIQQDKALQIKILNQQLASLKKDIDLIMAENTILDKELQDLNNNARKKGKQP